MDRWKKSVACGSGRSPAKRRPSKSRRIRRRSGGGWEAESEEKDVVCVWVIELRLLSKSGRDDLIVVAMKLRNMNFAATYSCK
jgi:hypothetical protein